MGYSKAHSERTKARILDSAAALFRSQGFEAASIDEIMAGAGLTRGGFYQHFASKEALFAEYVARELDFGRQLRQARDPDADAPEDVASALDFYLSPGNRERVARGEPEAALHLVEAALAAEPGHRGALEARLAALERLLERSGDVNHYEVYWLRHRIEATQKELGIGPVAARHP